MLQFQTQSSSRQKMINLMYVVLMAMLAINVPSEVLDGFASIEESLGQTTKAAYMENNKTYDAIEQYNIANPNKAGVWQIKAQEVRKQCDSLYSFAEHIKRIIAIEATGLPDWNRNEVTRSENLEAVENIMLSGNNPMGLKLNKRIASFHNEMSKLDSDESVSDILESLFSNESSADNSSDANWSEKTFKGMPVGAAIALLSKLQSDIRYVEGEMLHSLAKNIDVKDSRVNMFQAYVLPEATNVFRGDRFRAKVVMAAIDTTMAPTIIVNGKSCPNGEIDMGCYTLGEHLIDGFIIHKTETGAERKLRFKQTFNVLEPGATVSADMTNVLYAGYDNPISVSVPGVPLSSIEIRNSNGTVRKLSPGKYVIRPRSAGTVETVSVYASVDGKMRLMAQNSFKVRKLPDPMPYIVCGNVANGTQSEFFGGSIAKSNLGKAVKLGAAIDDGVLNMMFRVVSFQTVVFDSMGNAVTLDSDGEKFSQRQLELFANMRKNTRFFISQIKAVGPDGIERKLKSSIEIIVK